MPVSVAILALIALALLWVVLSHRRQRPPVEEPAELGELLDFSGVSWREFGEARRRHPGGGSDAA